MKIIKLSQVGLGLVLVASVAISVPQDSQAGGLSRFASRFKANPPPETPPTQSSQETSQLPSSQKDVSQGGTAHNGDSDAAANPTGPVAHPASSLPSLNPHSPHAASSPKSANVSTSRLAGPSRSGRSGILSSSALNGGDEFDETTRAVLLSHCLEWDPRAKKCTKSEPSVNDSDPSVKDPEIDLHDASPGDELLVGPRVLGASQTAVGAHNVHEIYVSNLKKAVDGYCIQEAIKARLNQKLVRPKEESVKVGAEDAFGDYLSAKAIWAKNRFYEKSARLDKNKSKDQIEQKWADRVEEAYKAIDPSRIYRVIPSQYQLVAKIRSSFIKQLHHYLAIFSLADSDMLSEWDASYKSVRDYPGVKYPHHDGPESYEFYKMLEAYYKQNVTTSSAFPLIITPDKKGKITDGHHRSLLVWNVSHRVDSHTRLQSDDFDQSGADPNQSLAVRVKITRNLFQEKTNQVKWLYDSWEAEICKSGDVYLDWESRTRIRHQIYEACKQAKNEEAKNGSSVSIVTSGSPTPDEDEPCFGVSEAAIGQLLAKVFHEAIPQYVGSLPHDTMRSFVGANLGPNFDSKRHRAQIDNRFFVDYLEFYVGEALRLFGLDIPTDESNLQLSMPRPKLKSKDLSEFTRARNRYLNGLFAAARMRNLIFGAANQVTPPVTRQASSQSGAADENSHLEGEELQHPIGEQFRELLKRLAKPGQYDEKSKYSDKVRNNYFAGHISYSHAYHHTDHQVALTPEIEAVFSQIGLCAGDLSQLDLGIRVYRTTRSRSGSGSGSVGSWSPSSSLHQVSSSQSSSSSTAGEDPILSRKGECLNPKHLSLRELQAEEDAFRKVKSERNGPNSTAKLFGGGWSDHDLREGGLTQHGLTDDQYEIAISVLEHGYLPSISACVPIDMRR